VNMRTGIVLSSYGGMLAKILPIFKLGLGGKIGSGDQYISWIALDDVLTTILYAITNDSIIGPINAVSPNPVTNTYFIKTIGKVLSKPTSFTLPAFIARAVFGKELADSLFSSSTRVIPSRLLKGGYKFRFSDLESALRHTFGTYVNN
jgi:uncharacterized protein (TIGR01777 family)